MTLIFRPRDNFAKAVENTRALLRERVFEDIEISDFAEVEATDAAGKRGFARILNASGMAKDRSDKQQVQFQVMMLQRPDQDRGSLVLGAWKNAATRTAITKLLASIRVGVKQGIGHKAADKKQ